MFSFQNFYEVEFRCEFPSSFPPSPFRHVFQSQKMLILFVFIIFFSVFPFESGIGPLGLILCVS